MVYSLFHRRHDDETIPVLTEIIETPEADTPAADGPVLDGVADAGAAPAAGTDAPTAPQVASPDDGTASEATENLAVETETRPGAEADLDAPLLADYLPDAPPALAEPGDYDPDDLPVMTEPITPPLMAIAARPAFDALRETGGASAMSAGPAPLATPMHNAAGIADTSGDMGAPAAAGSDELLPPLDIPAGGEAAFASILTPHIRPLPTALADLGAHAAGQPSDTEAASPASPTHPPSAVVPDSLRVAAGTDGPAAADAFNAPRPTEADIRARAEDSLRAEAEALTVRLRDDLLARLRPRLGDLLDQRIAEAVGDVLAAELPRLHARIEAALVGAVGDLVAHAVADELDQLDTPALPDA